MPKINQKNTGERQVIRGKGWKRSPTIAADKYQAISKAILQCLGKTPMTFGDLAAKVADKLPNFDGSIPWYTITCLRELEMQGKVTKHAKPVRYSKPSQP